MSQDTSQYSQITEPQERMIICDTMIISSIGFAISVMILYSLVSGRNLNGYRDVRYYVSAVRCAFIVSITAAIWFLLKICTNDLVLPIGAFITSNTTFISVVDSLLVATFCVTKITAYFGFTFMHLSTFHKPKMDNILKVLLAFVCGATIFYITAYLVYDSLVFSLKEIGFTSKRHIYVPVATPTSKSIVLVGFVVIVTDFIFLSTLLSCYIFAGRRSTDDYDTKANGVRGVVLVSVSIFVLVSVIGVNTLDFNIKYLVDSFPILADLICLYLMFRKNEEIYDHLCGCVCGKCCSNLCFGSYYKVIAAGYEEGSDIDHEEQNNNDRLPFNEDPSFML